MSHHAKGVWAWLKRRGAGLAKWGSQGAPGWFLSAILVLYILVLPIFGFFVFYYGAGQPQPVPRLTVVNGTDAKIIAAVPSTITVLPWKAPTKFNVTIDVIRLRSMNVTVVGPGSNLSSLSTSTKFEETSLGTTGSEWTARVAVTHPGTVETINEMLTVVVVYHYSSTPSAQNYTATTTVTLPVKVVMSDFPSYFYLFILSLGVIASRVAPRIRGNSHSSDGNGFSTRELVWVPFSVVVSLLIFTAFRQQVTLTTDIVMNFALAFGFGFAFDKALSSAPAKTPT